MVFTKKLVLFLSSLLWIVSGAMAQSALSLRDAISLGLERNYDIRIERKNVEVAENNNSWGEAGRMPTVTLNATHNNSLTNTASGDQFFNGQTFPGFELNRQINSTIAPTLNLNWNIFDGNRANISKARLADLQAESEGNAQIVVANTVQAIILAYYIAVLEEERLGSFKTQLELSRDRYINMQVGAELGTAVSSDVLLEEGNYLNDSVNYINQQLAYRDALRGLNFLLNKSDMNRDYQFTDALDSEAEELDYAELANKLESSNIDLKTIYLTQAVLHNNIGIAKADRMPRLSVDLGYGFNRSVQDLRNATSDIPMFEAPDETFTSDRGTYFANFTLAFTLFNGNRINRAIKNAIIQEDIGTIRIERLRSSINRDLADAYDQYNTRLKLYHINKRRVEAASVNLEISKEKFSGGSINSFDYRTVQNNNLIAEIQLLQSLYNLIDSKVVIQRLTGGILDSID